MPVKGGSAYKQFKDMYLMFQSFGAAFLGGD